MISYADMMHAPKLTHLPVVPPPWHRIYGAWCRARLWLAQKIGGGLVGPGTMQACVFHDCFKNKNPMALYGSFYICVIPDKYQIWANGWCLDSRRTARFVCQMKTGYVSIDVAAGVPPKVRLNRNQT